MNSTYIYKKIQELLDSEIAGYKIEAETGVRRSLISRLRNGHLNLETTSTKKTLILFDYAIEHLGK